MSEEIQMVEVQALYSIKYNGKYYEPKTVFPMDIETASKLNDQEPAKVLVLEDVELSEGNKDNSEVKELFMQLDNMEESFADQLIEKGFDSFEKLQEAKEQDLLNVKGIGKKLAGKLIKEISETELG